MFDAEPDRIPAGAAAKAEDGAAPDVLSHVGQIAVPVGPRQAVFDQVAQLHRFAGPIVNGVPVFNLGVVLVQAVGDQLGELQELFSGGVVHKTLEPIPVERIEYVASHTCPPKSRFSERRGDTTESPGYH